MALTRCRLCKGRKKVYRIGKTALSLTDTGGVVEICPECKGTGFIRLPVEPVGDPVSIEPSIAKKSSKVKREKEVVNG